MKNYDSYDSKDTDQLISEREIYLFKRGSLFNSYHDLGAHLTECQGEKGVRFIVWAPHAKNVSVVGNFNNWDGIAHQMKQNDESGIWALFIPDLTTGDLYKYEIQTVDGKTLIKADPYAFYSEIRPKTASMVYPLDNYTWQDKEWQKNKDDNIYQQPMNIYEVHLGSWKQKEDGSFYNYRELAPVLVEYMLTKGYTHLELMPINEHPFDRSWGYQITGYYAITSRYGNPDDFKYLIDYCHQHGIGVILDWVPGHFCKDNHGLRQFDGTPLYEYSDPTKANKAEWGTLTFDFGKNEVQSFLISNALFWFDVYHIDGLRVDAVSSMLYFETSDDEEERINQQAIDFLQKLNKTVFEYYPEAIMIAEESSAWPLVSYPTYAGGLGFNFKWNMGWMNDMLEYMEKDPVYRKWHHNLITFSLLYAFKENFILPISHDEVVYGKKSLLNKMPGDYWQKFANMRAFLGYMMTHPGKKLMFMGGEFGQYDEWKDQQELDWFLLGYDMHKKMDNYVSNLNHFYLNEKSLWQLDHKEEGFEWIDPDNNQQSIISFIRKSKNENDYLIILCNFTPQYYENYKIGVPEMGWYQEVFNSDLDQYGGSGKGNRERYQAYKEPWHNRKYHLKINIPPLAMTIFKRQPIETKLNKRGDFDE